MKERFISAFLIVSMMCVAIRGSGTTSTSYLRSQHRQLRADNNLTISAAQENETFVSSIPLEEATTMEEEVDNGTMVEGDKEVELPPNPSNASNATLLVDSPPPHADDVNATDDNMTNWMTPVTLNSSLPIEETSMIETNNTLTDEVLDMSNSTNNTSSLTVTPSTLVPPPQLNETTFEEEESSLNDNVTDTANATNATAIPDLDLTTFNATTSAPTTTPSLSTPTPVTQTIFYSPTVSPTPPNGFNTTTTSAPTTMPTIAAQTMNRTNNPTIQLDSVAISSPPTIAPMIRSPTVNPIQESEAPTLPNLDLENATNSNSTSLLPSPEPTSQPIQDYDDDYDYNYDDDDRPWTYDGEPANVTSPTPTPLPTYPPSTTVEANSTIYQIYYPTDFEEEEEISTDSPSDSPTTHYPTYSPTTTRKGERVRNRRERRKKNWRTAPTGSPTVVTKEFLEDVSASKTVGLVIGIILTIFGIGCCAWCV